MERVLIAGATGALGQVIAGKLLERGYRVRGLARNPDRLANLVARGLEPARGDLLDPASLAAACRETDQIVSTANSFMGSGAASPTKVDVAGYTNLMAAAKAAGVRRVVHVSAYGIGPDTPVDYFRVKARVDEVIRSSGIPWVLLKPSAFLDVWIGMVLTEIGAGRPARIFGDGRRVSNYIAASDVAEFAARIVARPEIAGETIDIGGPSTLSALDLVALIESHLGRPAARKQIPLIVLRLGARLVRPFNELLARFMAMGAWSAAADRRLDHWRAAADRFQLAPMTAEGYLATIPKGAGPGHG
ncbi:MAG: SDR family oxidoreductase [Gemmatimonadetes bacterium]|nr:SDR family oxidoreductase [Gemmatimonadota bacterium]